MQELSRLVSDSLAQNGVNTTLNYQRLEWSRWFRCESRFGVLLAPSKPGIFALGEEMGSASNGSKRMLALFEIVETGDLGIALGRLFLPGNPLRERLESGNCFARYTVIADATERKSAYTALRRWMEQAAEGINWCGSNIPARQSVREMEPSVSFALETEVSAQRSRVRLGSPSAMPSGV